MTGYSDNISLILCRPKHGGNVGAAARAAKNMGVNRMVVVAGEDLDGEEMKRLATHFAHDIIERITYHPDLASAVAPFQWIVGTTSKLGKGRRPAVYPREAAREIAGITRNNQVALLFGPEDNGLTNEDLLCCHRIVTIPAWEEFPSLNLAQAVMILCYEIFVARGREEGPFAPRLASQGELEGMYGEIKTLLGEIDFLKQKHPDHWLANIRRFFARTSLCSREVQIIRGVCRQLRWYGNKQKPRGSPAAGGGLAQ